VKTFAFPLAITNAFRTHQRHILSISIHIPSYVRLCVYLQEGKEILYASRRRMLSLWMYGEKSENYNEMHWHWHFPHVPTKYINQIEMQASCRRCFSIFRNAFNHANNKKVMQ